jgi:hypothetical protein
LLTQVPRQEDSRLRGNDGCLFESDSFFKFKRTYLDLATLKGLVVGGNWIIFDCPLEFASGQPL